MERAYKHIGLLFWAVLLVSHLGWYFLPETAAWQAVAQGLVRAFL